MAQGPIASHNPDLRWTRVWKIQVWGSRVMGEETRSGDEPITRVRAV